MFTRRRLIETAGAAVGLAFVTGRVTTPEVETEPPVGFVNLPPLISCRQEVVIGTAVPNGVATPPFNGASALAFNLGCTVVLANGTIQVPVRGVYSCIAEGTFAGAAELVTLSVNNSTQGVTTGQGSGAIGLALGAALMNCNGGDLLRIRSSHPLAGAVTYAFGLFTVTLVERY